MKTFNFISRCLFAAAIIMAVVFTGCQKDELTENRLPESEEIISTGITYLEVPEGIKNQGNNEVLQYLESLSFEEYLRLEEATRIKAFLRSKGSLHRINKEILSIEKLASTDMAYHLSIEELDELAGFDLQEYVELACNSGEIKHTWTERCDSRTRRVKRCGNVYGCSNGMWSQINDTGEVGCFYTGTSCDPNDFLGCSGETISNSNYLNDLVCESAPNGNRQFKSTVQELSLMAAEGSFSEGSVKLQSLFIEHQGELMQIFSSSEGKYQSAQNALREFLLVNDFILKNGFDKELGEVATIGTPHLEALQNLSDELTTSSISPKLRTDLTTLSQQTNKLEGQTLKKAITSFTF